MTVHNFYPGPAVLPGEALDAARAEFRDFAGTGISLLETSHRAPEYEAVHNETEALVRKLMDVPSNYKVLFLQGGASLQFAAIPMNLVPMGGSADYLVTGWWSEKALTEANIVAIGRVAADTKEADGWYRTIPKNPDLDPGAAYVHVTSNNTIMGTQYFDYPETGDVPLIADMSSDIMWRPTDVSKFGILYAGAHKNLGPSGVTVMIIREDLVENAATGLPTLLSYRTHVASNSMFNTPPTFTIYMVNLVLKWIDAEGGLPEMEKRARARAKKFYDFIDGSGGFYTNRIATEDRSVMNAVFDLPSKDLEAKLVAEAKAAGMLGLRNFHPEGGGRMTMYNALPMESLDAGIHFLAEFAEKNG